MTSKLLTAVTFKYATFWDMTLGSLVETSKHSARPCCSIFRPEDTLTFCQTARCHAPHNSILHSVNTEKQVGLRWGVYIIQDMQTVGLIVLMQMSVEWFTLLMLWLLWFTYVIQDDSGGKINILAGESISHCQKKNHMNMSNSEWLPTELFKSTIIKH